MEAQTLDKRTEEAYLAARAAVLSDDRLVGKETLLGLPPLYLIAWCRQARMIATPTDD